MFVLLKVYNALPHEEDELRLDFEREFGERLIEVKFPKLSDEDIRKRAGLSAEIQCSRVKDRLDGENITKEETGFEVDNVVFVLKRHLSNRFASRTDAEEDDDEVAFRI